MVQEPKDTGHVPVKYQILAIANHTCNSDFVTTKAV